MFLGAGVDIQPYDMGSRGQAFSITHPVDGIVTAFTATFDWTWKCSGQTGQKTGHLDGPSRLQRGALILSLTVICL